jgi:hypothetical protein
MESVFLTRPNRAARIKPRSSADPPFLLLADLGGIVSYFVAEIPFD